MPSPGGAGTPSCWQPLVIPQPQVGPYACPTQAKLDRESHLCHLWLGEDPGRAVVMFLGSCGESQPELPAPQTQRAVAG